MTYFEEHYKKLSLPIKTAKNSGFRPPQLAALHSIAAHFLTRKATEPAIVTMPTGSGKTAVLVSTAFMQRAKRVLVVTPSRLLREQIAEDFRHLDLLRTIDAIDLTMPSPKVFVVDERIKSKQAWNALSEYDVVIGTTLSISPALEDIPEAPQDLFDLLLIDEAHHSPARTWQALLDQFPKAKRVLFTATPFRNDQKEIKGRFIYTYSLKQAYEDKIFGKINFQAVPPPKKEEDKDIAIAKAAEKKLFEDREAKLDHILLIRTDSVARGRELEQLYLKNTNLKVKLVTGAHGLPHVRKTIKDLENNSLDGIICVNMFGEGFNFPRLKVAALHSPHKSLAITLQFIGRFARVTGENLGEATFLAIPSDIEIETEKLYREGAVWQEIIQEISGSRIQSEMKDREFVQSFEFTEPPIPDLEDLSIYTLTPYNHVKIYSVPNGIDLSNRISFPPNMKVIYAILSNESRTAIYITQRIENVNWSSSDIFTDFKYDLFIFHHNLETDLLFVSATFKKEKIYTDLVKQLYNFVCPATVPFAQLNNVLNGIDDLVFYNVGMQNLNFGSSTESYRIMAGSAVDEVISATDAKQYSRGHFSGSGMQDGEKINIGLSMSSLVWSNTYTRLPEFVRWCDLLASQIKKEGIVLTNTNLDWLSPGMAAHKIPKDIMFADWDSKTYRFPNKIYYKDKQGKEKSFWIIDFDLRVDLNEKSSKEIVFKIENDEVSYKGIFSIQGAPYFREYDNNQPNLQVSYGSKTISIAEFLNEYPLHFLSSDFGRLTRNNFQITSNDNIPTFPNDQIIPLSWKNEGVDIQLEFGDDKGKGMSIHDYLIKKLSQDDLDIIYYDHGTGEIADLITIKDKNDHVFVNLYHVKKSSKENEGSRVDDFYEVSGQAAKSSIWCYPKQLLKGINHRFSNKLGKATFIKGGIEELETLFGDNRQKITKFEIIVVQPGLKKSNISDSVQNILASASEYIQRGGREPLKVLSS